MEGVFVYSPRIEVIMRRKGRVKMWWVLGIVAGLILLIMLFLITKVHITIRYLHHRDNDSLTVRFRVWGIISYTYKVPLIAIDSESPSIVLKEETQKGHMKKQTNKKKITKHDILDKMAFFQRLLENIENFHKILKRFLSHMTVSQFDWHTRFGLGDAAWTGIATGAVWSIKGNILALMDHYMNLLTNPQLSVEPVWQEEDSETNLSCMISFRIGHAMGAGLQIVKFWKKKP